MAEERPGPETAEEPPAQELGRERRPPGPTRTEAVQGVRRELKAAGLESARTEAERLVAAACGIERAAVLLGGTERLSPDEAGRLARYVSRRLAGEPLQHIEGTVAFRDLVLRADARALVPRPETEQLVDRIAAWVGERAPLASALDVGTGSGAIALSLLTEGLVERAVGLDVSAEALDQARENRDAAGIAPDRFELRLAPGEFWSAVGPQERFDLIVSNPPYVRDEELESLPREVRQHDPRVALAGGPDGLDLVREIVRRAARHLGPRGALFLEVGLGHASPVRTLLAASGEWADVDAFLDLAGRERFLRAIVAA